MELKRNQYVIDGVPVTKIVEKYGSPLYIYESAKMVSQYKRMMEAFKDAKVKINYAAKALTNLNILKLFKELGSGLDAVSIQEVKLGLKAGFDPQDIVYTPNCVSIEEIDEVAGMGVKINIDNISILEQFGDKYGSSIPVCVRINPHIMAGGNQKISTGHIDSKFGISIYQTPLVKRIVEANNMKIEGLHMHTGSDILDVDVFLRGAEICSTPPGNLADWSTLTLEVDSKSLTNRMILKRTLKLWVSSSPGGSMNSVMNTARS